MRNIVFTDTFDEFVPGEMCVSRIEATKPAYVDSASEVAAKIVEWTYGSPMYILDDEKSQAIHLVPVDVYHKNNSYYGPPSLHLISNLLQLIKFLELVKDRPILVLLEKRFNDFCVISINRL